MPAPSVLVCLPLEILLSILKCLPHNDLLHFRLVSSFFLAKVTSVVFSRIAIDFSQLDNNQFPEYSRFVKSLATTPSLIASSVRSLEIVSLLSTRYQLMVNDDGSHAVVPCVDQPGSDKDVAQAVLFQYLPRFLCKLQNLEAVAYVLYTYPPTYPPTYIELYSSSLRALSRLTL